MEQKKIQHDYYINKPIRQFINELLEHNDITMKDVIDKGGITVKDGRNWMIPAVRTTLEINPAGKECNRQKITITEKSPVDGWVLKRMTLIESPIQNVPKYGLFFVTSVDTMFGKDVDGIGRTCNIVKKFGETEVDLEETDRRIEDEVDVESDIWAKKLRDDRKIEDGECTFKDGIPCKRK